MTWSGHKFQNIDTCSFFKIIFLNSWAPPKIFDRLMRDNFFRGVKSTLHCTFRDLMVGWPWLGGRGVYPTNIFRLGGLAPVNDICHFCLDPVQPSPVRLCPNVNYTFYSYSFSKIKGRPGWARPGCHSLVDTPTFFSNCRSLYSGHYFSCSLSIYLY